MQARLQETEEAMQAMADKAESGGMRFDQMIAPSNTEGYAIIKRAIDALVAQTAALEAAASSIGIAQLAPDTADHAF